MSSKAIEGAHVGFLLSSALLILFYEAAFAAEIYPNILRVEVRVNSVASVPLFLLRAFCFLSYSALLARPYRPVA
jgi:hypothetical protein